ncbi:MAG: hypothetical protein JJE55_08170 [Flavobacteriaceae bacterium]|nr:hypothetical protein [Flavobacteriaceae bacterium]
MKNLLLILTVLITALTFAQDGYKQTPETYQAITAKVSQLDTTSARAFADRLAGTTDTQFAYLQTKTTAKATKIYYTRTDLTQKEQVDQAEMGCSDCLVVYFRNQPTGLVFWQVSGDFNELLPMWQTEFLDTATAENAKESYKYRELKDKTTGLDIRFDHPNGTWQIYNWTK